MQPHFGPRILTLVRDCQGSRDHTMHWRCLSRRNVFSAETLFLLAGEPFSGNRVCHQQALSCHLGHQTRPQSLQDSQGQRRFAQLRESYARQVFFLYCSRFTLYFKSKTSDCFLFQAKMHPNTKWVQKGSNHRGVKIKKLEGWCFVNYAIFSVWRFDKPSYLNFEENRLQ